jgi:release factor glutamine methyltransferase
MGPKTWTIRDLLKVTTDYLQLKGIDSPRASAEILLAHHLKVDRIDLYLHFDKPLQEGEVAGYRSLIKRRLNREPIQYITGRQEFWSLAFRVGPGVLIPRPESELLVEESLGWLRQREWPEGAAPSILDLGTGSGALIVSLAREFDQAALWASDLSEEALRYARENAMRYGLDGKIAFLQGDLFEPLKRLGLVFDVILSNPPYVPSGRLESLMPEVAAHEPRVALDGGPEGMACIRRIILEGADYLKPQGCLLVEMDPEQTPLALEWIDRSGRYGERKRIRDYSHRHRVVVAQKQ